jgi:predicted MFS family arabinose efflux permease
VVSESSPAAGWFAPFAVRSYRFQWPADMLTLWGFEMENLVLGWYVLSATGSALWLSLFAALQFGGTLLSPLSGVFADRIARRTLVIVMRILFTVNALTIMALAATDLLEPWIVVVLAGVTGLVRPSEHVMRNALIADTVPSHLLSPAMSLSRVTMDSARIAGAIAGAGLMATLGIAAAYAIVAILYAVSALLTLGIGGNRPAQGAGRSNPFRDLLAGFRYIRSSPTIVAVMFLAFLVNFAAYPVTHGLLPAIATRIYGLDETGLAWMLSAYACGALFGSLAMVVLVRPAHLARFMIVNLALWAGLLVTIAIGLPMHLTLALMVIIGLTQSFGMISMSVILLLSTEADYRGRVQGVRTLAVYGLPLGLLFGGALIEWIGVEAQVIIFSLIGFVGVMLALVLWRNALWTTSTFD